MLRQTLLLFNLSAVLSACVTLPDTGPRAIAHNGPLGAPPDLVPLEPLLGEPDFAELPELR